MESDPQLQQILTEVNNGKNIILHAPGGTGKSYTLRFIAEYLTSKDKRIACTATTGVAAINLNIPEKQISASTLHSWAGVGLAQGTAKKLYARIYHHENWRNKWIETDILILDEVSMLGAELFDKLDYIGRNIRMEQEKPFGGLQLILSGDFLQLPPVKDDWVFLSSVWKDLELIPFIFDIPKRYDDEDYFQMLLRIRSGEHTERDMKKLRARIRAYQKLQEMLRESDSINVVRPTTLYSRKMDVNHYNEVELDKLPGQPVEYIAEDTFTPYNSRANRDHYIKLLDDAIPPVISLKVGTQVMLKINFAVGLGLVNGSRGVVLAMNQDSVYIRFINGEKLIIPKNVWSVRDKDGQASRSQIPFILAWALTIHKCQGSTLDYAVCDIGSSIFAPGQAYVALSRVRNLQGLFISKFHSSSIRVDPKALGYSRELLKNRERYMNAEKDEPSPVEENSGPDDSD